MSDLLGTQEVVARRPDTYTEEVLQRADEDPELAYLLFMPLAQSPLRPHRYTAALIIPNVLEGSHANEDAVRELVRGLLRDEDPDIFEAAQLMIGHHEI